MESLLKANCRLFVLTVMAARAILHWLGTLSRTLNLRLCKLCRHFIVNIF